jgi:hypothetical protein
MNSPTARIPFLVARTDRSGPGLVELATAVSVVALLGAIAMRPYLACREHALDVSVESAVRNAAVAQQARLADGQDFVSGDCNELPGYVPAPGVACVVHADATGYVITAHHDRAGRSCTWDSRATSRRALDCA